jgi:Lon protease-like protein
MQQGLLPLFPLEVVLMPGGHLPLHIFEERYKEMVGEALRDKTEFGIVMVSGSGLAEVGCTASIEGVLREYPDGRLDIVTLGRRRFEILLVNQERNFLRGAVEFFDDDAEASEASEEARRIATDAYNALQTIWGNQKLEEGAYADPFASFRLARAIRDLEFRQTILRSRSEADRIRRLAAYLPELAARIQREQAAKDAAPRNGRPHLNGNGPH